MSTSNTLSRLSQQCCNILLIGAPGVGKGTFARMLRQTINAEVLESGALCRAASHSNGRINGLVSNGALLDDAEIFDMVQHHLNLHNHCSAEQNRSVLFDGFPRNLQQAEHFDASMLGHKYRLDLAVYFHLPRSVLVQKLLGRRICKNAQCDVAYNVADINEGEIVLPPMKPVIEDRCDTCESPLVQRSDDTPDTVENRLNAFYALNEPMLEWYQRQNILLRYDIKRGIDDFPDLLSKIESALLSTKKSSALVEN